MNKDEGFVLPILITIVLLIVVVLAGGYFFLAKNKTATPRKDSSEVSSEDQRPAKIPEEPRKEFEDFSITIPEGWSSANQIPGTLVTITNVSETHPNDPAAQKINFKSYISVSFDNTQGKNITQLIKNVTTQLTRALPNTKIASTKDETIDGQAAKVIVMTLNQQGVDFTVMVTVVAKRDKYFVISANTPTSKWKEYEDLLSSVTKGFKFEY